MDNIDNMQHFEPCLSGSPVIIHAPAIENGQRLNPAIFENFASFDFPKLFSLKFEDVKLVLIPLFCDVINATQH